MPNQGELLAADSSRFKGFIGAKLNGLCSLAFEYSSPREYEVARGAQTFLLALGVALVEFTRRRDVSLDSSIRVIQNGFDFSSALLLAVETEGLYDELDPAEFSDSEESPLSSLSSSPLSSPLSSPPPTHPSSPAPVQKALGESSAKKRKVERSKQSSKKNRAKKRREAGPRNASEIQGQGERVMHFAEEPHPSKFSLEKDARVASTVYEGSKKKTAEVGPRIWRLEELVGPRADVQFKLIHAEFGKTKPVVDSEGRIFALVVYPSEPGIKKAAEEAAQLLNQSRKSCSFSAKQKAGRRGAFPALNAGFSHGNGRMHPQNFHHNKKNNKVLRKLTSSEPFQRLSGFATGKSLRKERGQTADKSLAGVFKTWAPRLYTYCENYLEKLVENDHRLKQPFSNSVLPAAAFNFGPQTVCFPHIDFSNLPFNWCWIWALGWYDWSLGGHIVLWDLKTVVVFPPGSLIALPSGVCCHSNTSIQKGESRFSFTQYAPGANFRWVDNGFAVQKTASRPQRARWGMGLSLFSTLEDLGLQ
ncbi:hypothetical protein EV361DRAFT_951118 [Lentinula raphanica]|nr:hypothetical protein EV361DRAFT_951118 [Lentinula raphanica]